MILHYITIALRNLERQKISTLINVVGLSLGLACFTLFMLYAVHEFSYDKFHRQRSNIYRVYEWWKFTGREGKAASSATPIGPAMKSDLAGVNDFVRVQDAGEPLVRVDGNIQSAKLTFADSQILSVFTGNICIFLACLGLFGLASLTTVNRTKEIGIRKVLGASVVSIARLLCHEFAILVLIAIVIAAPVAWYLMDQWLAQFAYKIELSWLTFALTGLAALAIAVLTVSVQALKAALADPVRSLRSE